MADYPAEPCADSAVCYGTFAGGRRRTIPAAAGRNHRCARGRHPCYIDGYGTYHRASSAHREPAAGAGAAGYESVNGYTLGDQNERIEPASLTKLFTAYVALQHLDPSKVVTVGEEAGWVAKDSSVAAVSEGCRLSAGLILQGMLMQSGNDAAYAIAVAAGRAIKGDDTLAAKPAYDAFIAEMNRQLESLGFTATHFTNPDGYHDDDHYTTPAELLRITQLAVAEPLIRECCSMESAQVYYDSGQEYTWKNTNWLIRTDVEDYYCPEATGLKTGSTSKAGMCLLATFHTEDTDLIVGVLGCEEMEDRFDDALALFHHYR